jgi:hypothetical protein
VAKSTLKSAIETWDRAREAFTGAHGL